MKIYRVEIRETSTKYAYILENSQEGAEGAVRDWDDICWRENPDYECEVIGSEEVPLDAEELVGRYIETSEGGVKFDELGFDDLKEIEDED